MPKRRADKSREDYLKRKLKRYQDKLQKLSGNVQDDAVTVTELGTEDNVITVDNGTTEQLPEAFVIALGGKAEEKEVQGQEIQTELADEWQKIMSTGLGNDAIDTILQKYPKPSNFKSEALKMNPEVFATLSDSTIKRDKRLVLRQNITGKIMSALGNTLTSVLNGDIHSKSIIEHVNDAAKLCAVIYYQDSISRRFFAIAGANQTLKKALRECKSDTFLFGTNCAETMKAAQGIITNGSRIETVDLTHQQNTKNVKPVKQPAKKPGVWRRPSQLDHQHGHGWHGSPQIRQNYPQLRHLKRDLSVLSYTPMLQQSASYS